MPVAPAAAFPNAFQPPRWLQLSILLTDSSVTRLLPSRPGRFVALCYPNYPISAISIHFFHLLLLYLKSPLSTLCLQRDTTQYHCCWKQRPAWAQSALVSKLQLGYLSSYFPFPQVGIMQVEIWVTWASLCWRLVYVLYESLIPALHLSSTQNDNLQNCLFISVRDTHIQTRSPLGNIKSVQIILKHDL